MADFKWYGKDASESIVVPSVRALAVYTNPSGDIVIRQEGDGQGDEPEDQFVVIPRSMVRKVVKAINDESKKPFDPTEE